MNTPAKFYGCFFLGFFPGLHPKTNCEGGVYSNYSILVTKRITQQVLTLSDLHRSELIGKGFDSNLKYRSTNLQISSELIQAPNILRAFTHWE